MKEQFNITGMFYEHSGYKCRKYLDIRCKSSNSNIPDLMVIMMNPGASKPINGVDNSCEVTLTIPDRTQDQIMEVMRNTSRVFARILNLSDLRTPKSKVLYDFICSEKSKCFPHSIFDPQRNNELNELFIKDVPVIFAWGIDPALNHLAEMAIKTLKIKSPIGKLKTDSVLAYYHPLPRGDKQQIQWVNDITHMLNMVSAKKTFRFFYAKKTYNTWPKLFVLSDDGVLYSEYLNHNKLTIYKESVSCSGFDDNQFKWEGYQPIVEINRGEALCTRLTNQVNWVEQYMQTYEQGAGVFI
ncbi:DUF1643 domain-containing protein [Shewanella gaetbuli]|uniref:DUF1643 domain-containing protein n=1 Tax=Shewanella gaetbuli TaxID=220752 RepID=A0A9X1ZIZ7_9GAMM|nr:DUF1643 domain-containing protein [Shewanella gaetbuli]MCL1143219.1 DUF1643 domain-containing protein [Shewanella gaetbuli]